MYKIDHNISQIRYVGKVIEWDGDDEEKEKYGILEMFGSSKNKNFRFLFKINWRFTFCYTNGTFIMISKWIDIAILDENIVKY